MIVTYDPMLVALSILIAISGGYTCFHLMERLTQLYGTVWKTTLVAASVAIGGGIWSMHFVGMLALHLPVTISYDLNGTLLSAMIAFGVTAIALYLVTFGAVSNTMTAISGTLMGTGISGMHYIGMDAIRGNCVVSFDPALVALSVLVGVGASTMALYLSLRVRNKLKQLPAAVAMGLGIAGMHYTGMYAASFAPSAEVVFIAAPVLENDILAVVITAATFLLFGSTFLLAAPAPAVPHEEEAPEPALPSAAETDGPVPVNLAGQKVRIPVESGKRRTRLEPDEIVCVQADSHYTKVFSRDEEFFCNLSISEIEKQLIPFSFCRAHRSHLVRISSVTAFSRQKDSGEVTVFAGGTEKQIPVSRGKLELLNAMLVSGGQLSAQA